MQGQIPLTEEKRMEGESMLTPLQGGFVTCSQRSLTMMIEVCGEDVTKIGASLRALVDSMPVRASRMSVTRAKTMSNAPQYITSTASASFAVGVQDCFVTYRT